MYDLVIGLRVYPGISKNPVLEGSKLTTFEVVYKSVVSSVGSLNTKIVVFSDGCGDDFYAMIKENTPNRYDLEIKKVDCFSNPKSFEIQYDYLASCDSRLVALIEDDYILSPGALNEVYNYAAELNFKGYFSFFNAADYYSHILHRYRCNVTYFQGNYWRTAASTTLTFLCSPGTLRKNRIIFSTFKYGNSDHNIWAVQTKLGWGRLLSTLIIAPNKNNFKRFGKFFAVLIILFPIVAFRREKLWVCLPGKGTHLETTGYSYDDIG